MMKKTKILATIGPASENKKILKKMLQAGMDAVRINASHTSKKQFQERIKLIKSVGDLPIILDTQGPEIRILTKTDLEVRRGQILEIGKNIALNVNLKLKRGDILLLDEGILKLRARDPHILEALNNGIIKNRIRVNIPKTVISLPSLTKKDRHFIKNPYIDYIALSYANNPGQLKEVRKLTKTAIIAKIENVQGLKNFDQILKMSDGIMIARGDLGVEISSERLPLLQKEMIAKCNQAGKLVITATQMLQSMISNNSPTRAETSDVANAILDGTDMVMLSGETAIGKYPVQTVREMCLIAKEVENSVNNKVVINGEISISEAISKSIYEMTKILPIDKVITLTSSGYTARIISRFRISKDIIAITPNSSVARKVSLYYGVKAYVLEKMYLRDRIRKITRYLYAKKTIKKNDLLLFTAGLFAMNPGSTNLIEIHRTRDLL